MYVGNTSPSSLRLLSARPCLMKGDGTAPGYPRGGKVMEARTEYAHHHPRWTPDRQEYMKATSASHVDCVSQRTAGRNTTEHITPLQLSRLLIQGTPGDQKFASLLYNRNVEQSVHRTKNTPSPSKPNPPRSKATGPPSTTAQTEQSRD